MRVIKAGSYDACDRCGRKERVEEDLILSDDVENLPTYCERCKPQKCPPKDIID